MPNSRDLANAIRFLSMDAVQRANSGHPGMPMGMADIAEVLWRDFLKHNPANPNWINRDRFILSNGHGSMLLYSVLHLTGYDVSIEDIKNFRQLNSITPGHPEYDTPGVETTTGPLGQGLANAVGMALAEKVLATNFNRPDYDIIDHYTYVFCGDGCLMEGISHEAASLAGHHCLGKLIVFWDDNDISIDGHVEGWFTDYTPERFEAYGWHVVSDVDGHDSEAVRSAIKEARFINDRPSLICCRTLIGYGAPNLANTCEAHGAPLGEQEIAATRERLQWPYEPFVIPDDIYAAWNARPKGKQVESHWQAVFAKYKEKYPQLAAELLRRFNAELPNDWQDKAKAYIIEVSKKNENIATRKASQNCLNAFGPLLPELIGGSADLTASNLTAWSGSKDITDKDASGNYLHYGVREFGMFAIMNGISLYGGFIPYGGTFLVFSDYGRNAIRIITMMKRRVIYVFTHDSIGLGEDGPTHQPIEHLTSLRAIPGLSLWRPCDGVETAVAWKYAIENTEQPTCLVLTRQKVSQQFRDEKILANIERGGYVLLDCDTTPEVILIATGSEVSIAINAAKQLNQQGRRIRVVSMPCTDVFDKQDEAYRESILPREVSKRIAIEAGSPDTWYKYVGINGKIIGINTFGKSAPAQELFAEFGFTEQNVIQTVNDLLNK
ncbi:MAG: transketolase [Coxiella sp. DG_40]|nr:MAG: transketolase [Coxiella sp. DG_40]